MIGSLAHMHRKFAQLHASSTDYTSILKPCILSNHTLITAEARLTRSAAPVPPVNQGLVHKKIMLIVWKSCNAMVMTRSNVRP